MQRAGCHGSRAGTCRGGKAQGHFSLLGSDNEKLMRLAAYPQGLLQPLVKFCGGIARMTRKLSALKDSQ
jgi:hypothetical protein